MSSDESELFKNLIANLEEVGVNSESIGFANVTMNSENFICVRENKHSTKSSLKIIDLRKGVEISDKPMTADSVIMNPQKPHLALRAQNTIQVFNVDSKIKVASLQIGFEIIFWNWADENTLLLVSDGAIYRWDYETLDSIPMKWFDKSPVLNDCQIINAEIDKSGLWCFLSGISLKNGRIEGTIQLYNEEKKVSQVIDGHAGNFFTLKNERDNLITNFDIFAFAARPKITDLKLHLIQINGNDPSSQFSKRVVDLPIDAVPENDFPIRVVYNSVYKLVFIYTKFGFVFVVEPNSGKCIMNEKYSDSPIYLITPSLDHRSHFVLNRKGDIYQSSVNIESFFNKCIEKGADYYEPICAIMNNIAMENQENIYRNYFDKLKNSNHHFEALLLVAKSGKSFLRTFEYLSSIKDFPNINETSALLEYFAIVLEDGKLNEVESLELVQLAINKKKLDIVRKWLDADQIFCTTQLGKVVVELDPELALKIFEKSDSEAMIIYSLALLGKFEEFSNHLKMTSEKIDMISIFNSLLKSKQELIPSFISAVIKEKFKSFDKALIEEILNADIGTFTSDVHIIFAKSPELLAHLNSKEINTNIAIKLIDIKAEIFSEFVMMCEEKGLELLKEDILPLLKESKMNILAFSFESNLEECMHLADETIGYENSIKSTNLSSSDVKKLVFKLIEENTSKYARLSAKMAEFAENDDFEEIKEILKTNIDEEIYCNFLIAKSLMNSDNRLSDEILDSVIKIQDESKLQDICEKAKFADPKTAFLKVSDFNYKSKALKILAANYNLHSEIVSKFESKNDLEESRKYFEIVGQEVLWSNLCSFIKNEISENFLKSLLESPKDLNQIVQVGIDLEKDDKLNLISNVVLSEDECFNNEPRIISLKLKLLSESDSEGFLQLMKELEIESFIKDVMEYVKKKNPKLALKYYLFARNVDEILSLSFQLEDWNSLSLFLINHKNSATWSTALNDEKSPQLFGKVIENSNLFPDTESASCLIKVLASKEDYEFLLKIISAWLNNNEKLRCSRSLQTLYIINLIKNNSVEAEEQAIKLDNYNIEEVLHTIIDSGKPELALKILEKIEQWNYAFKIALYALKNIEAAEIFAKKSGHPEAWHALAEFYLLSGDPIASVKYAMKSGNFRRQKELIIMLHLNEYYDKLLDYLLFLKSSPNYEPIYEREVFLCLMKLGKMEELDEFIVSADSNLANELGKVLYREGSVDLAAKCFKQAGNFERASSCFLKQGNVESAAELAAKTNKFEIWIDIVKFSLNDNKPDIARKFGIKCSQQVDRIQDLFTVYENCGAFENLLEIIEIILESSVPKQEVMVLIGEIYCRGFPDKLESFINRFYSTIPVIFLQILAKYRRWKEHFKLLLLRSNLDEALDVVIKHPSIEFDHHKLTAVIGKIKNNNVLERLLLFYYECNPRMIVDLQEEFTERLEMGSLIKFFNEKDVLFIFDKSMRRYQGQNPGSIIVSMGLNDHLIQINDYYGLIESIKKCPSIDAMVISETLKSSEQRHFRVLAAKLMANSGEFGKALSILIKEEALIETLMILSQSSNVQYAEAILGRYSRIQNAVMFMAVSYVLYDLLRPDVIFELSQRSQFQELCLPIFCQIMRHKLK